MQLSVAQIVEYVGGSPVVAPASESDVISGISWDSREIEPGCLYVALVGERVDGHAFAASALAAGAGAVLASRPLDEAALDVARAKGAAVIEVTDCCRAVTDLARAWRGHLHGRVVAITGSSGKTTTKNLVRDVAAADFSVVATRANQNNELGVPRTLLAAGADTEVVVVEMGMRGLGQIAELCDIVRPDWGLITNMGESHIELLGSRENIARAKSELFCALSPETGRAFVNVDDDFAAFAGAEAQLAERGVFCAGYARSGEVAWPGFCGMRVWAEDLSFDGSGRPSFTLCIAETPGAEVSRTPCALALSGLHNVSNACAAAAVGASLGMAPRRIAEALGAAQPESGRQEMLRKDDIVVVNDAYNANPDSMRAALATFGSLEVPGARVAVLGDMGELGDFAPEAHRGIGRAAAAQGLDLLVCVGELSALIAESAVEAGMPAENVVRAGSVAEALEALDGRLAAGDAVLVKASHFMGLEGVVEGLVR